MSDIVVDANVWAMADRPIIAGLSKEEENCIRVCRDWLEQFVRSEDRLIVDWTYRIISEYRRNISVGGFAEQELNKLEAQSGKRFIGISLEFDEHGHAILPADIAFADPEDRKFIALAIQFHPYAPIYNATDTDWSEAVNRLAERGLTIYELCPDYIQLKRSEA